MKETFIKIGLEIYPIAWCSFFSDGVYIFDKDGDYGCGEEIGFFTEYFYVENEIELCNLTFKEYKLHQQLDWDAYIYAQEKITNKAQDYLKNNPRPKTETDSEEFLKWFYAKDKQFEIWIEEYKEEWYKLKGITKLM